jgi:hypothetical protein
MATALQFTTSAPGFMGSIENLDQDFVDTKLDPNSRILSPNLQIEGGPFKNITLYIHGTAEHIVGYDIPIWLAGSISAAKVQPCTLFSRSGDAVISCMLVLRDKGERWLGYICQEHEVEKTINELEKATI